MNIVISLDATEPPTGRIRLVAGDDLAPADDADPVSFAGWLGLLRALEDVIGPRPERPPSAQ